MTDFVLWIVISDKRLAAAWYRAFSRESFTAQSLATLNDLNKAAVGMKGLAIVELGQPDMPDAKALKTFITQHSNVSIIAMADRALAPNSVIAETLESGADDFILREIDERVLLSKVKAHLRRVLPTLACAKTVIVSKDGDMELDRVRRTVKTGLKAKKQKSLDNLTPREFEILSLLLCNEEQVVSRNFLMEEIWKEKSGRLNVETIDKHVEILRQKLGPHGKSIRAVYGTGYIFRTGEKS